MMGGSGSQQERREASEGSEPSRERAELDDKSPRHTSSVKRKTSPNGWYQETGNVCSIKSVFVSINESASPELFLHA